MAVLRDPLAYSNWVWVLGAALLLISIIWVVSLTVAYRRSKVRRAAKVESLTALKKARYRKLTAQVNTDFTAGNIDSREAHFALAAIIRAAATEKTGVNIEVRTAAEAADLFPSWPGLFQALQWCEDETFPPHGSESQIDRGIELALGVIGR